MEVKAKTLDAQGIKFSLVECDRGRGLGTQLVEQVIEAAKEQGCYKLIVSPSPMVRGNNESSSSLGDSLRDSAGKS